jgi:hypothetical protein
MLKKFSFQVIKSLVIQYVKTHVLCKKVDLEDCRIASEHIRNLIETYNLYAKSYDKFLINQISEYNQKIHSILISIL